jgi:hypothetical protein
MGKALQLLILVRRSRRKSGKRSGSILGGVLLLVVELEMGTALKLAKELGELREAIFYHPKIREK